MIVSRGYSIRGGHAPLRIAVFVFAVSACLLEVQNPVASVNVGNLILVAGGVLATVLAALRRKRLDSGGIVLFGQDWIYCAYICLATASALWSPSPLRTTVQAGYLLAVWIATVNLGDADTLAVVKMLVRLAVIAALLSFAVIPFEEFAFQPKSSTGFPELRGIFSHQLRLGVFMAMAIGLMVIAWLNGHVRDILGGPIRTAMGFVVLVTCLIAAFARLYSAAMVVSLFLSIGVAKPGWRRVWSIACVLICVVTVWVFRESFLGGLSEEGFDISLTGRTFVWANTLSYSEANPWLGNGYASFDHPKFDQLFGYYRPAHPHNSYIQAYFETGILGLSLTLALIGLQLRAALRVYRNTQRYSYSLFLILLAAIGSITGSNYAGKPTLLLSMVLLFTATEAREIRRLRLEAISKRARSSQLA